MKKKKEWTRDEKWNWKETIYRSKIFPVYVQPAGQFVQVLCQQVFVIIEFSSRVSSFINSSNTRRENADNPTEVISLLQEVTTQSGLPPSQLSKAISRISTEYRLQFAWPRRPQLTNGETVAPGVMAAGLPAGTTGPPRKSLSMGALKQGIAPTGPAPVHKKRPGDVDHKRDGKWNISTNL